MKEEERTCKECKHFGEEGLEEYYACMRYPPGTNGYFSKTKAKWVCGEFRRRGKKEK